MITCQICDLGTVDYSEALKLQNSLVLARVADKCKDSILLLEHPPVVTIGRSGSENNILALDILKKERIPVFHVDRGGDITFHGLGQLVVYPIIDLKIHGRDIHKYVRNIEEVIIRVLDEFSITGKRHYRYPGVWVGEEKICALGIGVSHWITKHGIALNVNTDLKYFSYINPCGLRKGVTSMSKLVGHDIDMQKVKLRLLDHMSKVFGLDVIPEVSSGMLRAL